MTDPRLPPPQTVIQAAGQTAAEVVGGLKQQPLLLGIVVLNIIGIGAALWFLDKITTIQHDNYVNLVRYCFPGSIKGHDQDKDHNITLILAEEEE